MQNKPIRGVR